MSQSPSSSARSAPSSSPAAASEKIRGKERRRHRVYVTRNTEYHFRDGFCVAVRDRRTGEYLQSHLALRRRVHGGIKFYLNGGIQPNLGEPQPGEALYFESGGHDLVTSPLISVDRPTREVVQGYLERR
jgi:hypothetical protein